MLNSEIKELIEDTLDARNYYSIATDKYTDIQESVKSFLEVTKDFEESSIGLIDVREEPLSIKNNQYLMY